MCDFEPPNRSVLKRYAAFLNRVDETAARQWGNLCHNDLESASCEAYAWGLLSDFNVRVKPNNATNSHGMSVDFRCEKDRQTFYVEVTCIKSNTMTTATGLDDEFPSTSTTQTFEVPTNAVLRECKNKAKQCSEWDFPVLLFVGTFHSQGSTQFAPRKPAVDWILTGEPSISWDLDFSAEGEAGDTYLTTSGKDAAFLDEEMKSARKSISGILLAGFGINPPNYCGVLHPEAVRPFDPAVLDRVPFGRLEIDRQANQVSVKWP